MGKYTGMKFERDQNKRPGKTSTQFNARIDEFQANALKAVTPLPQSREALQAACQPMLESCAACHKDGRIKDEKGAGSAHTREGVYRA